MNLRLVAPVWSRSTASGKVGTGSVILTSYEGRQQRVPDPIVSARASNGLDRFLRSKLLNRVTMDSVGSGPDCSPSLCRRFGAEPNGSDDESDFAVAVAISDLRSSGHAD